MYDSEEDVNLRALNEHLVQRHVFTLCSTGFVLVFSILAKLSLISFLDREYNTELRAYETGKRHLARIMGEDPDTFTQKQIDVCIFLLFRETVCFIGQTFFGELFRLLSDIYYPLVCSSLTQDQS